jgi:hypothetical protein
VLAADLQPGVIYTLHFGVAHLSAGQGASSVLLPGAEPYFASCVPCCVGSVAPVRPNSLQQCCPGPNPIRCDCAQGACCSSWFARGLHLPCCCCVAMPGFCAACRGRNALMQQPVQFERCLTQAIVCDRCRSRKAAVPFMVSRPWGCRVCTAMLHALFPQVVELPCCHAGMGCGLLPCCCCVGGGMGWVGWQLDSNAVVLCTGCAQGCPGQLLTCQLPIQLVLSQVLHHVRAYAFCASTVHEAGSTTWLLRLFWSLQLRRLHQGAVQASWTVVAVTLLSGTGRLLLAASSAPAHTVVPLVPQYDRLNT